MAGKGFGQRASQGTPLPDMQESDTVIWRCWQILTPRFHFAGEFSEFEAYFRSQPHTERVYGKGDLLWKPGQPYDRVNYYVSGASVCYALHETGRRRLFCFQGPGTMLPGFHTNDFRIELSLVRGQGSGIFRRRVQDNVCGKKRSRGMRSERLREDCEPLSFRIPPSGIQFFQGEAVQPVVSAHNAPACQLRPHHRNDLGGYCRHPWHEQGTDHKGTVLAARTGHSRDHKGQDHDKRPSCPGGLVHGRGKDFLSRAAFLAAASDTTCKVAVSAT